MVDNLKTRMLRHVRRFVSHAGVKKVAKAFGITAIGKKIYFAVCAPKDKKISQTISGISAQFNVDNYHDFIYLTETAFGAADEREAIERLLENIRPDDVVYDVGAFVGLHAIFSAKKTGASGRVIAFEPSPYAYQALQKNIELNHLDNVTALPVALGNQTTEKVLQGDDSLMYSLSEQFEGSGSSQKITVVPGDMIIAEKQLPGANVVKIDVEGYEYQVIKGLEKVLRDSACRFVYCEVHPLLLESDVTAQMVLDLLTLFGFTRIETHGRDVEFHAFCYKV